MRPISKYFIDILDFKQYAIMYRKVLQSFFQNSYTHD